MMSVFLIPLRGKVRMGPQYRTDRRKADEHLTAQKR